MPGVRLDRRSQPFLCGRIFKTPGASAAHAADRASSIHRMKIRSPRPPQSLVKVGRRKLVRVGRRLTGMPTGNAVCESDNDNKK
jgi:hypothetical protein